MSEIVSVRDITFALLETKDAIYLAPERKTLASGRKSSLYFDVGDKVISNPDAKQLVVEALAQTYLRSKIQSDRIVGVPDGMKNLTSSVGDKLRIGQLSIREKLNEHRDQRLVEGSFEQGMRVAIFEDVMSTGGSTRDRAIQPVRAVGLYPSGVFTLIDRGYGGMRLMEKSGIPAFTFTNTLEIAYCIMTLSAMNDAQLRLLREEIEQMKESQNQTLIAL